MGRKSHVGIFNGMIMFVARRSTVLLHGVIITSCFDIFYDEHIIKFITIRA